LKGLFYLKSSLSESKKQTIRYDVEE